MTTYRVLSDTSTRASADPDSPDFETWVHFSAGSTARAWPEHAPVNEWVESGHWAPIIEAKASAGPGEPMTGVDVPRGKSATLTVDGTSSVEIHDDGEAG